MNLHLTGEQLTQYTQEKAIAFDVQLERGGVASAVFQASSPPVNHEILQDASGNFQAKNHKRYFFWTITATGTLGTPRRGDVVIDGTTRWRVVPNEITDAPWEWHGQGRAMVRVETQLDEGN